MKRTKEEAEITKKTLLETAFNEFLNTGFEKTSLEVIAKKAGVTRGALYWHFKDKDGLLDAVIKFKDNESLQVSSEIFSLQADPFEKLKSLVSLNFPEYGSISKEKKYVRMKVELYNYLNRKGDKRKVAEKFMETCRLLLDECRKRNQLKDGIDTESAAHTILSICAGSYIRFNSVPGKLKSISKSKKIALDYLNLIHK